MPGISAATRAARLALTQRRNATLREALADPTVSQAEAGRRAGVTRSWVNAWMRREGVQRPPEVVQAGLATSRESEQARLHAERLALAERAAPLLPHHTVQAAAARLGVGRKALTLALAAAGVVHPRLLQLVAAFRTAAEAGQPAPSNQALGELLGLRLAYTSALVSQAERTGLIRVVRKANTRQVGAADGSWRTAPPVQIPPPGRPRATAAVAPPDGAPAEAAPPGPPGPDCADAVLAERHAKAREHLARRADPLQVATWTKLPLRGELLGLRLAYTSALVSQAERTGLIRVVRKANTRQVGAADGSWRTAPPVQIPPPGRPRATAAVAPPDGAPAEAAPPGPPGPDCADAVLAERHAKAREHLARRADPLQVATWTKLPLREVYRLAAELRQARRVAA